LKTKLDTGVAPHIRTKTSTKLVMLDVIIALLPAIIASIVFSPFRSALLIFTCVISAVLAEAFWQMLSKKDVTVFDLSAVVTGLLLSLLLPETLPLWMAAIGAVFAILVVKQFFGGLGNNFINPALAGYAFLLFSWFEPVTTVGALSEPFHNAIISIAILAGGLYLIARKVINWRTPIIFIVTVLAGAVIITLSETILRSQAELINFEILFSAIPLTTISHLLLSNLIICAFFMATDPVSTPLTYKGQVYFALGAGILTIIIDFWGVMPSGAVFAVLIMNVITPLIDKISHTKRYARKNIYHPQAERKVDTK